MKTILAVCAHPDDESFGLGAILSALAEGGSVVRVLCFTQGEASTLGESNRSLGEIRAEELEAAAAALGISDVDLLSYPDGHLNEAPVNALANVIESALDGAELLVVFDEGGITGHPDHCQATRAALVTAKLHRLPVLAWVLPERVAVQLNDEYGTTFAGRPEGEIDAVLAVRRERQKTAIACHASQAKENPVLWRRLELLGMEEHLCWLYRP